MIESRAQMEALLRLGEPLVDLQVSVWFLSECVASRWEDGNSGLTRYTGEGMLHGFTWHRWRGVSDTLEGAVLDWLVAVREARQVMR